jgi:serine/threonine-protein kinase RsbW
MLAGNSEVAFPMEIPDPRLTSVRRFVAEAAERAGLHEERVFDLTLAASEACANALEHGRGCDYLTVSAREDGETLHIEVLSPGRFELHPCRDKVPHERGFGLPLMVALADEVTFTRRDGGTRVRLSMVL